MSRSVTLMPCTHAHMFLQTHTHSRAQSDNDEQDEDEDEEEQEEQDEEDKEDGVWLFKLRHPHKHALKVYIYVCVPVHKHLRLDQTPERIDEDIATQSRRWPRVGACGFAVMRACAYEAMLCLWSPPGRTAGLCRQTSTSRFRSQTTRCKRS